jgi:hypothetical protein
MNDVGRNDGWILTHSGVRFYPARPNPADIRIHDIAHSLSNQCRFGGHIDGFYSVAEHCVRVSYYVPPGCEFPGLMHDASEAYVTDLPTPIKYLEALRPYRELEKTVQAAIGRAFRIDWDRRAAAIHRADVLMRNTEAVDLMPSPEALWQPEAPALVELAGPRIVPLPPPRAKAAFLRRFHELFAAWEGDF